MALLIALILVLISTFLYYRYTKSLRACVAYSKDHNLSLLGSIPTSEVALISNIFFSYRLLRYDGSKSSQDTEQMKLLALSKKNLLIAVWFNLMGAGLVAFSMYAR